jgi:type II secretory pathway pseudopilin PulG
MERKSKRGGYSLIELMFALGVVSTLGAMTVPTVLAALDDFRTLGAVRYLATRLQRARMEAVSRHTTTAMRFVLVDNVYRYAGYVDGDRDGVRSADISQGIDRLAYPEERLSDQFPDVDFGALPGLPAVDASSTPPGSDPVRFGSANSVSFTPLGTATPGSLYVLGARGSQYAVRVFGETGKTRILKFNRHAGNWEPR